MGDPPPVPPPAQRPSGLRPPSNIPGRIARPSGLPRPPPTPVTPHHPPTPLTPAAPTPRASGVAAQKQQEARIRKINEEVSRMKLADVEEEDLETPSYYDRSRRDSEVSRRSSLGNGSRRGSEVDRKKRVSDALPSAEALWESARRLSEAGVRRCSDASVILTEDTDSFIIGDKVWVGGTKPGQIAYIGETQFAPGEWAGVVLDETIGKNDGSVAGVRYFQCEAKRGVFSRLTRLTRTPLATLGEQDGEPTSPVSRRPSSALSHTGSLRGENKLSPSPTPHDMSNSIGLHSPSQPEPRVGERVIVMSSQGSKAGVLRYIGTTEFAAGMWAGVELDDPVGKNDGSVGDKRYFECMPKYGLFAPVAKVSRSPSSGAGMRRGVCSVHHTNPNSTSTSSLRRRGSRESIASTTGSTSSAVRSPAPRVRLGVNSLGQKSSTRTTPTAATMQTTLQNTLRDKEQYIEQLLKERELERAEVTRAASQVDDAEQKLSNLKLEFEQYQEQMQAQLQDAQLMLSGIELDKRELATQLEEERRRVEDLQFRFEEASIAKIDMEGQDEVHLERIKELEKALQDERKRAEELELESNRAFEMEENLAKVREEAEQELRVKIEELGTQLAQKETILGEKEQALQAQEKEMTVLKSEVEGLKKKSIAQEEGEKSHSVDLETMKQENAQLVQRIQAAEDKFNQVLKEKQLMEEKVNELQALNTEKVKSESEISTRLVKETERIAELESQLCIASEEVKGATEKYSSYLSESKKDIEELKKAKDEEISSLKQSLQKEAEAALKLKQEEVDKMSQMCSEIKAESQKDLEELKNRKDSEIEGLRMSLTKNGDEALKAKQEELDKMSQMFSDLKAESKKEMEELKTRKDAEIEGLKQSLVKHGDEALKAKQEELDKMSQMYSNLIDASKKEIEDLRAQKDLEMDELKKSLLKQKEEALLSKEEELEKVRQSSLDFTSEARKEIENLKKERDAELESVRQSLIKQSEESLKAKLEEVDRIHEELNNYKIQSSKETELLLSQKNSEIEDLKQSLLKEGDEALKAKQQEVENLKQEISSLQAEKTSTVEELEKAHKAELETLRTSCQSKDDEISRLKSELESLMSNVEGQKSVTEEAVSVMRNKMEEVCVLKDNLMKEKEEMIPRLTQLQGEVVTLKEEKMKMDETLLKTQSWLETMTSQMSQLLCVIGGNVNVESPVPSDESKDVKTSDPEKMAARLKSVGSMIQSCAELGVKMKGVMEELEETKKREAEMISSFQSEKESLEQMAQSLKSLLEKQEKDIQERQQEINQLNAEKSQANKYKTLLEGLEREKTQLERKVVELQVAVAQSKANANNEDSTYQNLMAEKEMAQGQIDFLNSVIVDMQRKNDDLKARVEILEIGITPADADELNLNGIKPRMVAPRLFCDICDVFDLHDTEDCPRQASDSPPPLIKHHRAVTPDGSKSKRIVPDRPYCDTCEVFGHDTADCEDGETF
ncbi:CAP-Gly domain-containing linker protein 1 isoform X4 [Ischnura elegans]|uniref:CAP-Gly domain-containing linker protein 1 isoform X4 n=1 Tax=Ischnura elegans TaxID=197161 RepID=UPI001ED87B2F|nr:CAP-Gly domain-containing linker protein 1 isoform X4 [Ischnura elegans]